VFLLGSGTEPPRRFLIPRVPRARVVEAKVARAVCALFEGGMYSFVFQWVSTCLCERVASTAAHPH
jgi:hypothetical protein